MKMEVRKITPKIAEAMLKKNHPNNRPIQQPIVNAIARDIETGNWKVTHQGICFDAEGYLIDGQHRLSACVQSGKTIEILVVVNESSVIGDPIDRHRVRTMAYLTGKSSKLIAALRVLRDFEDGYYSGNAMTTAEVAMVFEKHHENFELLKGVPGRDSILGGVLAALIYAAPVAPDKVVLFATQVSKGEMIKKGDPAFALRNWLAGNKKALQPWDTSWATLNCVGHFLAGKTMRSVYSGESGFRFITTKRRTMKIPHTAAATLVPTLSAHKFEEP